MKANILSSIDIGTTLRKHRDRNFYTQQYIATYLGISRVAYRKWENNEVDFTVSQLLKIGKLYNIQIHEIIKSSYSIRLNVSIQPNSVKKILEKEFSI